MTTTPNDTSQYSIHCDHKHPVPAGTVVVFRIEGDIGTHTPEWQIEGPFTGMRRTFGGEGKTFDWDTEGERAGSYTVSARLLPDASTDSTDPADAGKAPPPVPPQSANRGFAGITGSMRSGTDGSAQPDGGGSGGGSAPGSDKTRGARGTWAGSWKIQVTPAPATNSEGVLPVSLQRTSLVETVDQALWVIIRDRTNAIAFRNYRPFIDTVMSAGDKGGNALTFRGGDAYGLLKFATDLFVMQEAGVLDPLGVLQAGLVRQDPKTNAAALLSSERALDSLSEQLADPDQAEALRLQEQRRLGRPLDVAQIQRMRDSYYVALKDETPPQHVLPYLQIVRDRLADIPLKPSTTIPPNAYGILRSHLTAPLAIELFWSYWHEEGMLAQTLNAILARFQNRRTTTVDGRPDPLARFDVDPLRPLGNIFWGWAEDEIHRLTVRRRHYEYEHEYGLPLLGRAIPSGAPPADRRSQFLESFHNLLFLSHVFFKEDDDTTVIADGFPLLNALRETHLLLAEGAHNQFGDLPSAARSEMLIMQWLLARPELRDFLGGRVMVPYEETWMDRVDSMKTLQGWTDVSVAHFRDLGVFGEQIVLSIRYGNWSVENDSQSAANWARYWRPEIQRYVHAYRSATGADLTERVDSTVPALHLAHRMARQQRGRLEGSPRRRQLPSRRDVPMQPGASGVRGLPQQAEYE